MIDAATVLRKAIGTAAVLRQTIDAAAGLRKTIDAAALAGRWAAGVAAACGVTIASTGLAVAEGGDAAGYPARPIHLVVGYSPGGGNDIVARILAARMSDDFHQPVVVDNRPGAQSIVAAEQVAKAPADGYTLLIAPTGPMTINPAIYSKLPYAPLKDFAPITIVGQFPLLLVVSASSPVTSVQALIEYARAHPDKVNYASSAAPFQLAAELFNQRTGTRFAHIPYKGSGDSVNAVIAGEVTMTISDSTPIAGPLKSGRLRGLAVTSERRSPAFPTVPTMAEAGVSGMEISVFSGLVAPAGTPETVIARLQQEVAAVVRLPDVRERFMSMGIEPVTSTPEEFTRIIAEGIARWTSVAKSARISAD